MEQKKNLDNNPNDEHNEDDVVFDDIDEEGKSLLNAKELRKKLRECEEEKREYLTGWQRAKADYINLKKRDEESRINAVKYAKEDLILSLIPILDSFEMAFHSSTDAVDDNWLNGMTGIMQQMISMLKEHGVDQMNPLGEEFDPNLHDSVESRNVDDKDQDGTVIEVRQKGYAMDGKVLRAAKVVVGEMK